ncbi:hypothetical protein LguiB_012655 [Lonicera macranthoides]
MESFDLGRQIHCHVLKVGLDLDVYVSNVLMDIYAKCGRMDNSVELFLESSCRNDFRDGEKALSMFLNIHEDQAQAAEVTNSSVLHACASLAALEVGNQIHSLTIQTNYDPDVVVSNGLIDMYAKCGNIKDARLVFDVMNKRDVVSWNDILSTYSMHGIGGEALRIF